jgi:hypothetical protein
LDEPGAGGAAIRAISVLASNDLSGTLEKEIYTSQFTLLILLPTAFRSRWIKAIK